jgi:hypothetical protein
MAALAAQNVSNPVVDAGQQAAEQIVETASASRHALFDSFDQAVEQVILWVPNAFAAIVVLVVGYFVARLLSSAIIAIADRIGLHRAAERSGLLTSMQHVGIKRSVSQILGTIIFWLLMCVFLMAACNILGLPALTQAMQSVVDYIPKLLVATIVVVLGLLVAKFLQGVIATSADRVGVAYAQQLATACYWVLAAITFFAACEQLNIEFELLKYAILIAFAGLALGVGLSCGLGGRDVMAGIMSGYYVRQRMQSGDRVDVGGLVGTVREVGPVATIIETEEEGLLHRHSIPNAKMLREAVR